MILLAIIILLTVLEAIHEGLVSRQEGSWVPGEIENIKLFIILSLIPVFIWYNGYDDYLVQPWKFWSLFLPKYIIGWVCIRYALFDIIYNISAGNKWYYIGRVKLFDRLMRKFTKKIPRSYFSFWTRFLTLILGISLILKI